MKKLKTLCTGLLLGVFALFTIHAKAGGPLEDWERTFPDASKALGKWVKKNKDAATFIFNWDGDHPERSQELVSWAIANPGVSMHKFRKEHKDWTELDDIEKNYKSAFEEFLDWCRNYADAAKDLMAHPSGLKWAGDHIYQDAKDMKKLK